MTQNLRELPEPVDGSALPENTPAPHRQENPVVVLHRVLAGRYHWAVLLGIVLGVLGGGAARLWVRNVYRSEGAIQITPVTPRVMARQETIMPMFNSYMDAQVALILSERTILMAMESADWKDAVPKDDPRTLGQFMDSLRVEHERDGELITVSFTDRIPKIAAAGVKSIIDAYMQLSSEKTVGSEAKLIEILESQKAERTKTLTDLNQQILNIADKYGTDDLTRIREAKQDLILSIEHNIYERKAQLALVIAREGARTQPADAAPAPPVKLTPEMIARSDPRMRDLLNERDILVNDIASKTATLGPAHTYVQGLKNRLQVVEQNIASLVQQYEAASTQPVSNSVAMPANPNEMSRAQLELLINTLQQQRDETQKEMLEIGAKALLIGKLKMEVARVKEDRDNIDAQLKERAVEAQVGGRTSVQSTGNVPFRPVKDRNRSMTILGGCGGLALGIALVALRGLLDRRLRSVADTQLYFDRSKRVLGILPALPDDLTDPEQAATAAYCVHHIRTLLQLGANHADHQVVAVTSAGPGDGKTSLVMSLGHSYASTGAKTLLIDFDLVGMGMSLRAGVVVRRKIGDILVRAGLVTPEQRDAALTRSFKLGKHLGQTLVDDGLLTAAALDSNLEKQRNSTLGLLDVLEGEPLAQCVAPGGPNLSILRIGDVGTRRFGQVSLSQVQRILQEAKEKFEVVLIDTGPVLGSLEACVVTAAADEVIMVVARGQKRPLIGKAFARLSDIGANVAGLVFNRAAPGDVEDSNYTSYRASQPPEMAGGPHGNGKATRRLGPITRAVVDTESTHDLPGGTPK